MPEYNTFIIHHIYKITSFCYFIRERNQIELHNKQKIHIKTVIVWRYIYHQCFTMKSQSKIRPIVSETIFKKNSSLYPRCARGDFFLTYIHVHYNNLFINDIPFIYISFNAWHCILYSLYIAFSPPFYINIYTWKTI